MNKTKEPITSQSNLKPIPISKKCQQCHKEKLINQFEFALSIPTKDHRAVTCNDCMNSFNVEEENSNYHSQDCITEKIMEATYSQLETLLALSENGVDVPSEILEIMAKIFEQDERNMKDLEKKD